MLARLIHEPSAQEIGQPLLTLSSVNKLIWFDLISTTASDFKLYQKTKTLLVVIIYVHNKILPVFHFGFLKTSLNRLFKSLARIHHIFHFPCSPVKELLLQFIL